MKIDDPRTVSWELFAVLDDEADARGATVANVLDVAAIVVAMYVERMRGELEARGLSSNREIGDRCAWRIFRERCRAILESAPAERVH